MPPYEDQMQLIIRLTNETLAIYPTFIGDWVFAKFRVPMSSHIRASKDIGYEWLLNHDEAPLDDNGKVSDEWLETRTDVKENLVTGDNFLKVLFSIKAYSLGTICNNVLSAWYNSLEGNMERHG